MTEDEAKTKMCCGHPASAMAEYYRAGAPVDAPMKCIASACMAWRWRDSARETEQTEVSRGDPPVPEGEGWKAREGRFRDGTGSRTWYRNWTRLRLGRRGFCGLAGAPQ